MLEQVLEVFKQEYEKKGEGLILDTYKPSEGTYIIVQRDRNGFEVVQETEIKHPKDKREDIDRTVDNMEFICMADYYSSLIDMNKPIDKAKIIHSNNYYSFFVKKPNLISESKDKSAKLTEDIIESYYSILKNPRAKYDKKNALQLYENVESKNGKPDVSQIDEIYEWIKGNLKIFAKKCVGTNYLKIFFRYGEEEQWLSDYKKESDRYLIPNLYNNNDTNVMVDGTIYGLPNYNMGLNAKKPYLENKTRKEKVPYLLDMETALLQKTLFDYLWNMASLGKNNIYIDEEFTALTNLETLIGKSDFSGVYLRLKKGKEVEIQDMDVIPLLKSDLEKPFINKNVLEIKDDLVKGKTGKISSRKDLEIIVNDILFYNLLLNNYYTEPKDIPIKEDNLYKNLLLARDKLNNWFRKGNPQGVWAVLNKVTLSLIVGSIDKEYLVKASNQFNLRISMKEYFEGGEDMQESFNEVRARLFRKVDSKEDESIETDKEYCYAVGQLVNFFITKNRGQKKPMSLADPIIKAKSNEMIKKKLSTFYNKYNYALDSVKDVRFKKLYSMVLEYENEDKLEQDWILAGFLRDNLIFIKNESTEINNDFSESEGTKNE